MMKISQKKKSSQRGLVKEKDYVQIEKYTYQLFERGKELAAKRGLILVDTKYEFGKIGDTIYLMDEIHTPDSSRYFYADGFEERQQKGEKQKQLSKEFVREWLIANGFMGKDRPKGACHDRRMDSDHFKPIYRIIRKSNRRRICAIILSHGSDFLHDHGKPF